MHIIALAVPCVAAPGEAVLGERIVDVAALVKNNRLEFVSDRYRYVASQHVADSAEAVAKAVYPELFAKGE